MYFNASDKEIVIDEIITDETEEHFDALNSEMNSVFAMASSLPPVKDYTFV